MSRTILLSLAMAGLASLLVGGCNPHGGDKGGATGSDEPINPPSTQVASLTGTLRGGMMAIGGETTGWTLAGDGAVGGIELDLSNVLDQAKPLEGKRVTVTGRWIDKQYVERGTVRILVVDKIVAEPIK